MCTDARQMAQASGLSHKYLFPVLCIVHNADWRSGNLAKLHHTTAWKR